LNKTKAIPDLQKFVKALSIRFLRKTKKEGPKLFVLTPPLENRADCATGSFIQ